jgi:transcription elongation factor SPT5
VFVTRARSLASLAPKGSLVKTNGVDLSKMNPSMSAPTGGMVGSGKLDRGPRDRHIGLPVTVIKGTHKGLQGTIKDTNGPIARVELRSNNKVVTIDKVKLNELWWVRFFTQPVFGLISSQPEWDTQAPGLSWPSAQQPDI